MRKCNMCGGVFPLENFTLDKRVPSGHTYQCYSCRRKEVKENRDIDRDHVNKVMRNWCTKNRVTVRKRNNNWRRNLRKDVLEAYGGECECCGEKESVFLAIDHINGGGTTHRKANRGTNIYIQIRREGFPEGYRILCHNCNWGYWILGTCPHHLQKRRKKR